MNKIERLLSCISEGQQDIIKLLKDMENTSTSNNSDISNILDTISDNISDIKEDINVIDADTSDIVLQLDNSNNLLNEIRLGTVNIIDGINNLRSELTATIKYLEEAIWNNTNTITDRIGESIDKLEDIESILQSEFDETQVLLNDLKNLLGSNTHHTVETVCIITNDACNLQGILLKEFNDVDGTEISRKFFSGGVDITDDVIQYQEGYCKEDKCRKAINPVTVQTITSLPSELPDSGIIEEELYQAVGLDPLPLGGEIFNDSFYDITLTISYYVDASMECENPSYIESFIELFVPASTKLNLPEFFIRSINMQTDTQTNIHENTIPQRVIYYSTYKPESVYCLVFNEEF